MERGWLSGRRIASARSFDATHSARKRVWVMIAGRRKAVGVVPTAPARKSVCDARQLGASVPLPKDSCRNQTSALNMHCRIPILSLAECRGNPA
eukprot:9448529-Prorocentrum_lima.AAC.1